MPTGAQVEPDSAAGIAATVALPKEVEEDLRRFVEQADEVTAQRRAVITQVSG